MGELWVDANLPSEFRLHKLILSACELTLETMTTKHTKCMKIMSHPHRLHIHNRSATAYIHTPIAVCAHNRERDGEKAWENSGQSKPMREFSFCLGVSFTRALKRAMTFSLLKLAHRSIDSIKNRLIEIVFMALLSYSEIALSAGLTEINKFSHSLLFELFNWFEIVIAFQFYISFAYQQMCHFINIIIDTFVFLALVFVRCWFN